MYKIRFEPSGLIVTVTEEGEMLCDVAERAGLTLESICGGRGKCGRCRVIVEEGFAPVTDEDRDQITEGKLERGMRLGCCLEISDDLVVRIPEESTREDQIILEDSTVTIQLDPLVKEYVTEIEGASLEYHSGDLERLMKGIFGTERKARVSLETLEELSVFSRSDDPLSVVMRGNEILDINLAASGGAYGAAVDIGTTTLVAYLMDLSTGECVAVRSKMNPQVKHGDDVLSRMSFAMQADNGREVLQDMVTGAVDDLIERCVASAGIGRSRVFEIAVVGNTAMHHLFFGMDTYSLGRAPYVPVVSQPYETKASQLGLEYAEEAYVYSPPNVAGFVGSDHIGVLMACRLWESEEPQMVMDIGTNGEISIGSREGIASTSCAAGPALEGANLKHGMRGATGAIENVSISDDLELSYSTIGNSRPKGICGSAAVDAVSEMFRAGIVDSKGKIRRELDHPRIQTINDELQLILAPAEETATGEPVSIFQKDISEILNAKAAMYVGASTLMEEMGVGREDLHSILLAGAFGNYISPRNAISLGILPEVPLDRVIQIGNAAGSGAKIALLNKRARKEAWKLAREIRYIELAARSDFQDRFYKALYIPHLDETLFPEVMSGVRA